MSSWEHSIRRGIQSRDLGWWVGINYLQSLPVKGKRVWVLVRWHVSTKKRGFHFLVGESEQVWMWKGERLWAGRTEDAWLIFELDT